MLIQFNFQNFKSFYQKATLDMTATRITEYEDQVFSCKNERFLPISCIYGANASGKSNVYSAFKFMALYVIRSFRYGDSDETHEQSERIFPTPFYFDIKSRTEPSVFEVYFTINSESKSKVRYYNYGFSIDRNGVAEEWLNQKSETAVSYSKVFYRSRAEQILDLPGLPSTSKANIEAALEDEVLVVSLGAKLKVSKLKIIRDWFINTELVDYGDPVESLVRCRSLPRKFTQSSEVQRNVISYLSSFDESIAAFTIEEIRDENSEVRKDSVSIRSKHRLIGSDEFAEIPLEQESAGTLKMFSLYQSLLDAIEKGSVLFVDELNARLHPLLVRAIVFTFINPSLNPKHAQLIFTAHDTWLMSAGIMRRDEIWFVEKDSNGISTLYSLVDFIDEKGDKIRKDESFEKNYLLGKYGAIPNLKEIYLF